MQWHGLGLPMQSRAHRVAAILAGGLIIGLAVIAVLLVVPGPWYRPWAAAEVARYRIMAEGICSAVERYRDNHEGALPSMARLLERDELLRKRGERLGFSETEMLDAFKIVVLEQCIHHRTASSNAYVLIVRAPPEGLIWRSVFVEGQRVEVACPPE